MFKYFATVLKKFRQGHTFYWSQEDSCETCFPDDPVVNVDIVAASVYGIVKNILKSSNIGDKKVFQDCDKETNFCKIKLTPSIPPKKISVTDHVMGEVQKVFEDANVRIVDDTKTVNELLWGFTDPGPV